MNLLRNLRSEFVELWNYRHLLRMLVVRDLKIALQELVVRGAWSFLQPLGMMIVLTFAFTIINKGPPDLPDFHVYILSGYLAWTFFSASVIGGAGSVVANSGLVKKVYFPARCCRRRSSSPHSPTTCSRCRCSSWCASSRAIRCT